MYIESEKAKKTFFTNYFHAFWGPQKLQSFAVHFMNNNFRFDDLLSTT